MARRERRPVPRRPPVWRHAAVALAALVILVVGAYSLDRALLGALPHDAVAWLFTTAALVTFGGA